MGGRRLQIINEDKQICGTELIEEFIENECDLHDKNYHIVSVLGPQSSGKSTLLNALFGTTFDIMSDDKRAQTTHGIWLSKSKSDNILVMDVEGTDGRERAEDQDFERKGALFSLAVSEVLIINMWEHSVGLYHGANMSLIKTILDVHLQLFKDEQSGASTTLLFVIRDFIGHTPAENLKQTILADLKNIWDSIKKPELFETKDISDVFFLEFAFLPHKILKPTEFHDTCTSLRHRFSTHEAGEHIFKAPTHSKIVPIDGIGFYLTSIWSQVLANKDLDLPNQQDLLAQYRCDELASNSFAAMTSSSDPFLNEAVPEIKNIPSFTDAIITFKRACLDSFSEIAHKYSSTIYEKKVLELSEKIDAYFYPSVNQHLLTISRQSMSLFNDETLNLSRKLELAEFKPAVEKLLSDLASNFTDAIKQVSKISQYWSFNTILVELEQSLQKKTRDSLQAKLRDVIGKLNSDFSLSLDEIFNFEKLILSTNDFWADILSEFNDAVTAVLCNFKDALTQLDISRGETDYEIELRDLTIKYLEKVLTESGIKRLVRTKFEKAFKYDQSSRPRVWSGSDDINTIYDDAKIQALKLLAELSKVDFSSIQPSSPVLAGASIVFIKEERLSDVTEILTKEFEMDFLEVKRSLIAQTTKIPPWLYVLIIILGWNEFMIILKNPLYLMLFLLLISLYGTTYVLGIQSLIFAQVTEYIHRYSQLLATGPINDEK